MLERKEQRQAKKADKLAQKASAKVGHHSYGWGFHDVLNKSAQRPKTRYMYEEYIKVLGGVGVFIALIAFSPRLNPQSIEFDANSFVPADWWFYFLCFSVIAI